jgi:hypothetical protein
LLDAPHIAGEVFNCCDGFVSTYDVAMLARKAAGSSSEIRGETTQPKHQIGSGKLQGLGFRFGGRPVLEATVGQLVELATRGS